MVDKAAIHIEIIVQIEEFGITVVGIETTIDKGHAHAAVSGNQPVLAIVEKVACRKADCRTTTHLHDAIGTVTDVGVCQAKVGRLYQVQAIGPTAIEVTIDHLILPTSPDADHPTGTGAVLGMTDGKVLYLAMVAIDEIETIGIARIHFDAGILSTSDDELAEIDKSQLAPVGLTLANGEWSPPNKGGSIPAPLTTCTTLEVNFILQDARQVKVHVVTDEDDAVITQGGEELILILHDIDFLTVYLVRSTAVVSQSAREVLIRKLITALVIGHSLLALDELQVGLLDDIQFHLVVIITRLVPGLRHEVAPQVLRLELPAVARQDLITHQTQLTLGELTQIGGIKQHARDDVAHWLLLCEFLLSQTILQIVGSQDKRVAHITIGLTNGQEVHTILTDIIDIPPQFTTDRQDGIWSIGRKTIG